MVLSNGGLVGLPINDTTRLVNNYQTINQWVKFLSTGPNGYAELWFAGNQYAAKNGIQLTSGDIRYVTTNSDYIANASNPFNTWMNFCLTINKVNGVVQFYKNGVFIGSNNFTPFSVGTQAVAMGYNYLTGNTDWMNGSIATTSLYDRILSSGEVLQNYNVLKGRFGL
jgi:hypothetical protein